MFRRDRSKTIHVNNVMITQITFAGVVQVGDVHDDCHPFTLSDAYGGYRGAPSFVSNAVLEEPINTRLHYANQLDEDVTDYNIYGEKMEMYRPNIRGEEAR